MNNLWSDFLLSLHSAVNVWTDLVTDLAKTDKKVPIFFARYFRLKPGSHMSPMIGESLSVIIQEENSHRILLMSNHRQ